jgi:hypothetical protein
MEVAVAYFMVLRAEVWVQDTKVWMGLKREEEIFVVIVVFKPIYILPS